MNWRLDSGNGFEEIQISDSDWEGLKSFNGSHKDYYLKLKERKYEQNN